MGKNRNIIQKRCEWIAQRYDFDEDEGISHYCIGKRVLRIICDGGDECEECFHNGLDETESLDLYKSVLAKGCRSGSASWMSCNGQSVFSHPRFEGDRNARLVPTSFWEAREGSFLKQTASADHLKRTKGSRASRSHFKEKPELSTRFNARQFNWRRWATIHDFSI